jgi:hypothetical protein
MEQVDNSTSLFFNINPTLIILYYNFFLTLEG